MIRCALAEIRSEVVSTRRRAQLLELVGQHLRVDHDAVADHAQRARVQDPRRDQVKLPGLAVADDRVTGVVAALKAHDRIGPLGEQVGDLPFAFVAPLGADDHDSWHRESVYEGRRAGRVPIHPAGTVRDRPSTRPLAPSAWTAT